MNSIVIVIPCYNEAKRLKAQPFTDFTQAHGHMRLLFVNDGSTDDTRSVIDDIAMRNPGQLMALHLPGNRGKAEAVRQGFLKAFELGADLVGFLDADLAAPLECIAEMEVLLQDPRKEFVLGTRLALLGRDIRRRYVRHIGGRVFATFASLALDLVIYDTQCGAKLFRNTPRLQRVFSFPFTVRWTFDVEILARFMLTQPPCNRPGDLAEIGLEYPLRQWIDIAGSKVRFHDFFKSVIELIKIARIVRLRGTTAPYLRKLTGDPGQK